jgi:hypothetical protein
MSILRAKQPIPLVQPPRPLDTSVFIGNLPISMAHRSRASTTGWLQKHREAGRLSGQVADLSCCLE